MVISLNNTTLYITTYSNKKLKLKELKTITNTKYITKEDLYSRVYFTIENESFMYLHEKYGYNFDLIKNILDNLLYIDKPYEDTKLNELYSIKQELLDNNLLKFDKYFLNRYKESTIIVEDVVVDKFLEKTLSFFDNVTIINNKVENKISATVFNDAEEEINNCFHNISLLIKQNIDINNIKIYTPNNYTNIIMKYSNLYNIPVNKDYKVSLYSFNFTKEFLRNYDTMTIIDNINYLKDKYDNIYINNIIDVINNQTKYNKEYLRYLFKNTYIKSQEQNLVEILPINKLDINTDNHIFILGVNQSNVPFISLDSDYLSDKQKKIININPSYEVTKLNKDFLMNVIKKSKNTYISCISNHDEKPSIIIDELTIVDNLIYSNKDVQMVHAAYELDNYYKYNIVSDKLKNIYLETNYNAYDNKYKSLSAFTNETLVKDLRLSYNAFNTYNLCQYRYLLTYLLNLSSASNDNISLGNLFHYVLSITVKNQNSDITLEEVSRISSEYYEKEGRTSKKDMFFKNMYDKQMHDATKAILRFEDNSNFVSSYFEKELNTVVDGVKINGIIDKILLSDDDENDEYSVIIDYKTGMIDLDATSLKYEEFGIKMQLLFYAFLLERSHLIDNNKIMGLYYQKVFNSLSYDKDKENYKLVGKTLDDESIISIFDTSYKISSFIDKLKFNEKKNCISKIPNSYSLYALNNSIDLLEDNIKSVIRSIRDANYDINPKIDLKNSANSNLSCNFCEFNDVCFKNNSNNVYIEVGE